MVTVLLEYIDVLVMFPYFIRKYLAKHTSSYDGIMLDAFSYLLCWHNRRVPRLAAQEIVTNFHSREIMTIQCGCSDMMRETVYKSSNLKNNAPPMGHRNQNKSPINPQCIPQVRGRGLPLIYRYITYSY